MNLNRGQILSIVIVVLGVLVSSSAQITDLFGPAATKYVVSAATLAMSIMAGINTVLQGQSSQIAAVQAMPGVDKIIVNASANPTLATLAVDPTQGKIQTAPGALPAITATAKAAAL